MRLLIDAYLLQWIWVGLIVVAAVIFAVRAFKRSCRGAASRKDCAGCGLTGKCDSEEKSAENDKCPDNRGKFSGGCGCC